MSKAGNVTRAEFGSPVELIENLKKRFGDRLTTSLAVRERHGTDESFHSPRSPDAVVFASSTEDVQFVVKMCARHRVPIIAYGTGTSLEGHVAALYGGICVDLSQMNDVLSVNAEDLDCTVQAGVTRKQLNEYLRDTGLFFAVDPGADASIGGMAATRASGTNAVKYGTMRETVMSLKVVLSDGRVIQTARRSKKSAAGYDLTRLFVGSEGTLGIITEITLRLYGIPEAIAAAVCSFPSIDDAVASVIATIQSGIPVARIELLDDATMEGVNNFSKTDYPVSHTLFYEFHGSGNSVEENSRQAQEIASACGGGDFRWETRPEDRSQLWQARHDALYAMNALRPGSKPMVTDVCVPISRLAECIRQTKEDIEKSSIMAPIAGHAGDGNFHVVYLVDTSSEVELMEAGEMHDKLVMRALAMGGTCTGEHGIGYGKIDFLNSELGEGVSVMRSIKLSMDPKNIMNPGKILRV